jgi:hypothetical protein
MEKRVASDQSVKRIKQYKNNVGTRLSGCRHGFAGSLKNPESPL